MKKLIAIIIPALLAVNAYGQYSVGPRAGINFCVVNGKFSEHDNTKNKWIVGPVAGITGNYSFTNMLSLTTELSYLTMGQKFEGEHFDYSRSESSMIYIVKERFNCLQFALLAQALFGTSILSYFVILGPFLTQKLGGIATIDDGNIITRLRILWQTPPETRGEKGDYYVDPDLNRRTDIGMYLGGGIGKKLGPGQLKLDLRFGFGMRDLNKFDNKEAKNNARDNGYKAYRSMNASFTLTYLYALGKQ